MSDVLQDVAFELSQKYSGDELFNAIKQRMPEMPDFYIRSVIEWLEGGDVEVVEDQPK